MENICKNCKRSDIHRNGSGVCLNPASSKIIITATDTCEQFVAKNQIELFESTAPPGPTKRRRKINPNQYRLFR